jgi:hypothetical protein
MKIRKKLKNAEFEYDEETKKFLIIDGEGDAVVELNKVMLLHLCVLLYAWLKEIG